MNIIFATSNEHKLTEVREILSDLGIEIISMKEAGINVDIVENGETFEENALIKVRSIRDLAPDDSIVLADDSGLEVDAMGGKPGVYSARFLGEDTPYEIKCNEIIKKLNGIEGDERSARFRCVIAISYPDRSEEIAEGKFEGVISDKMMGKNGFGYDPIFYIPQKGMTVAELSSEEKNKISHRGNALKAAKISIRKHLA